MQKWSKESLLNNGFTCMMSPVKRHFLKRVKVFVFLSSTATKKNNSLLPCSTFYPCFIIDDDPADNRPLLPVDICAVAINQYIIFLAQRMVHASVCVQLPKVRQTSERTKHIHNRQRTEQWKMVFGIENKVAQPYSHLIPVDSWLRCLRVCSEPNGLSTWLTGCCLGSARADTMCVCVWVPVLSKAPWIRGGGEKEMLMVIINGFEIDSDALQSYQMMLSSYLVASALRDH